MTSPTHLTRTKSEFRFRNFSIVGSSYRFSLVRWILFSFFSLDKNYGKKIDSKLCRRISFFLRSLLCGFFFLVVLLSLFSLLFPGKIGLYVCACLYVFAWISNCNMFFFSLKLCLLLYLLIFNWWSTCLLSIWIYCSLFNQTKIKVEKCVN